MEKKPVKKYLNILFFAVVLGLTLWFVFRGEDLGQVAACLERADWAYVVPAVVCVPVFIIGESVVIFYLLRQLDSRVRFTHCCLYSFVGFFYSAITPSASGGQPMQVLTMRKDNVPTAISTVVLAVVTITYKLVLVVIGAAVLLIRPKRIIGYLEPAEPFVYLGMALNVIFIGLLLLVVFHPGAVRFLAGGIFSLIGRIRPSRNPEKQASRLERLIDQYYGTAAFFRSHPGIIFRVFLITLVQRLCLFLVTWFTYRSFGLSGETLPVIVLLQAMISVAADMIPLPGGMGISESLFLTIFLPVFGEALLLPGMVLSRGISYYTQLLISGLMTAVAALVIQRKRGSI